MDHLIQEYLGVSLTAVERVAAEEKVCAQTAEADGWMDGWMDGWLDVGADLCTDLMLYAFVPGLFAFCIQSGFGSF